MAATFYDWCVLGISGASLVTAIASTVIAKGCLTEAKLAGTEAKEAAARAHADWAQQKWFDLYFKVDQAYNALERYQTVYHGSNPAIPSAEQLEAYNQLMYLFPEAHTMAVVFPKNATIDALFASTNFSHNLLDALSNERLTALSDALELLRQKALVEKSVLDVMLR